MKISFKNNLKDIKGDVLFVSVDSKNKDEIIKEGKQKTLYLKCDAEMTLRKIFILIRKMILAAKGAKAEKIAFDFQDFKFSKIKLSDVELAEILGTQLDYANYEFIEYKSKSESIFIKEVYITNPIGKASEVKNIEQAILKGHRIAEEVNKTRSLANTPGGDMTPTILAQKAREAVQGLPVKVTVLGEKEMHKLKMQAILSVGRGSTEESKFIIMEYHGGPKNEKPIVLVGKGVTFDSGGVNLKPSSSLLGMNMDMSGGASVIHAIALVARNKLKKNVIALVPSVENMVSGNSYRPGDVIRSMSGATIEVLNTDAEGRVILADALTYAQKYNPSVVIDVATLTGAAAVALGEKMSAIFTDDDMLCVDFEKIGEKTGEYFWRLPMWEEYEAEIKGSLGDWTNVHNKDSRYGGASYGAIFLKQFIKNQSEGGKNLKWAHIDMAPRMTSAGGDNLAPGATGTPTYSLYKFIEETK